MVDQDSQSLPPQNPPSQNLPPLYFHHATAFGAAGQINRPLQQTIPTQASAVLAPTGGHGTQRVEKYSVPNILSFDAAYVEVGGSFDSLNNTYTTYALSVLENLDIWGVIKADRVVSRLSVYYSVASATAANPTSNQLGTEKVTVPPTSASGTTIKEPSFSLSGSHFENLRIAGNPVNIQLALESTPQSDTYTRFAGLAQKWLFGENVPGNLDLADHNYNVVNNIAARLTQWNPNTHANKHFWGSAVDHSALETALEPSGLKSYGGMICVPRFGVVFLTELRVHHSHRHFNMIRVHMCSPGDGFITGGGTGGGGGSMPPG